MTEATPDLVGLTDVAEIIGVPRQNMRKLMLAHSGSFSAPVHDGSVAIWHLVGVLAWLQARRSYALSQDVLDVAQVAMQVNVVKMQRRGTSPAFFRIGSIG